MAGDAGIADKELVRRGGYPQFGAEGAAGDAMIADKKLVRRGGYPQFGSMTVV